MLLLIWAVKGQGQWLPWQVFILRREEFRLPQASAGLFDGYLRQKGSGQNALRKQKMLEIREMREQDAAAVAQIEAENFSKPWKEADFLGAVRDEKALYLGISG